MVLGKKLLLLLFLIPSVVFSCEEITGSEYDFKITRVIDGDTVAFQADFLPGGRVIGDVILDGKSLSKQLLEKDFAKIYCGGKKESWCE